MNRLQPAFIAFLLCIQVSALSAAETKPNIVFVLVDDQRNTSLGCAGHPQIKTPVIDSLAARGVHHSNPSNIATWFGVRDNRYTYANYYENGAELLYDRERDPAELTNVAADPAYAAVFAQLRQCSLDYKKQYTRTAAATSDESRSKGAKKKKSKKTPEEDGSAP